MRLKPGSIWKSRYRIDSFLGEGGFATVYRAYDLDLNREIALKILKPGDEETSKRFEREARLLSQLKHKNIVSVYAVEIMEDQSLCLVLEYIAAENLRKRLERHGPLSEESCREVFLQLADALDYAHSHGVVHRDLSAVNVLVEERDAKLDVKIIDFGVSAILPEPGSGTVERLTYTGFILGNPAYMSPEQARGEKVDKRSDIYSLGCILYEALAGRLPFEADSPIGMVYQQQSEFPVKPKPSWSNKQQAENYCLIALRCLQKNPDDRYSSCSELKDDLERDGAINSSPRQQWSDVIASKKGWVSGRTYLVYALVIIAVIVCLSPFSESLFADALVAQKLEPLNVLELWFAQRSKNAQLSIKLYRDLLLKLPPSSKEFTDVSLLLSRQLMLVDDRYAALSVLASILKEMRKNRKNGYDEINVVTRIEAVLAACKESALQPIRAEILTGCLAVMLDKSAGPAQTRKCALELLACASEPDADPACVDGAARELCRLIKSRPMTFDEGESAHLNGLTGKSSCKSKLELLDALIKNKGTSEDWKLSYECTLVSCLSEVSPFLATSYFEKLLKKSPDANVHHKLNLIRTGIRAYLLQGNKARVLQLIHQARSLAPRVYELRAYELEVLIECGEEDKARKLAGPLVEELPGSEEQLTNMTFSTVITDTDVRSGVLEMVSRFLSIYRGTVDLKDKAPVTEVLWRFRRYVRWAPLSNDDYLSIARAFYSEAIVMPDLDSLLALDSFAGELKGVTNFLREGVAWGIVHRLLLKAEFNEARRSLALNKARLNTDDYTTLLFLVSCGLGDTKGMQEAMARVQYFSRRDDRFLARLASMVSFAAEHGREEIALELLKQNADRLSLAEREGLSDELKRQGALDLKDLSNPALRDSLEKLRKDKAAREAGDLMKKAGLSG